MKILILLLISFNVSADPTGLIWVAPTQYTDNTPINSELAGFKVYYGTSSGVYLNNVDIPNPLATAITLDLGYGDHYAVITAYDIYGGEGDISGEVFKNIPRPVPKLVTGVSWVVLPQ